MTLYAVECEWDMGFNFGGYSGVYSSDEARQEAINKVDWSSIGEDSNDPKDFEEWGYLILTTIEG